MESSLSDKEKSYLNRLLFDHHEEYRAKIKEDLSILSRYKSDLAKGYEDCAKSNKTLVGCMNDIIKNQEELIGIANNLNEFMVRLENKFLEYQQLEIRDNQHG